MEKSNIWKLIDHYSALTYALLSSVILILITVNVVSLELLNEYINTKHLVGIGIYISLINMLYTIVLIVKKQILKSIGYVLFNLIIIFLLFTHVLFNDYYGEF